MLAPLTLFDGSELLIVVAIVGALLVFGPDKIPEMARTVGKYRAELDKATNEARNMMDTAMKTAQQESSTATSSLNSTVNDIKTQLEGTAKDFKSSFDEMVNSAQALGSATLNSPPSTTPTPSAAPPPSPAPQAVVTPPVQANEVDADALLKLAHRMGIETSGKTRDEISDEIFAKAGTQAPSGTT